MDFFVEIGVIVLYVWFVFLIVMYLGYYSIVIGFYLENYGIVSNSMYDFVFKVKFGGVNIDFWWWNSVELIWVIN